MAYHAETAETHPADALGVPRVVAVSRNAARAFSKENVPCIRLLTGLGVEGDAHAGVTVKHRSRFATDPTQPNLRQIHLIHTELLDGLRAESFGVTAGDLGENITTKGVYLLGLPTGARLRVGPDVIVEITGLRNPCAQLETFQPGLLKAVLDHDADGNLFRKAGVMGIVLSGGEIRPGDAIRIELPPERHRRLERV